MLLQQTDDVPTVARLDRSRYIVHVLQPESRILELLDHLARAEHGKLSALGVGAFVLAVLQRGIREREFAGGDLIVHLLHTRFHTGHFLRCVLFCAAHHDVRHLHLATSRTAIGHLDDVVSETGAHRLAHGTDLRLVRRAFEGIDHLQGTEPTEITAVLGRAGIIRPTGSLRHGGEILPFDDPIAQGVDAFPSCKGVLWSSLRVELYEDMCCPHLLLHACIRFLHQGVVQFAVDQVRASELFTVAIEFSLELSDGIHTQRFGFADLQLVVDEQIEVLVEGLLGDRSFFVVLLVDGLELTAEHRFAIHVHDHRIGFGLGEGGADHAGRKKQHGQVAIDTFHGLVHCSPRRMVPGWKGRKCNRSVLQRSAVQGVNLIEGGTA